MKPNMYQHQVDEILDRARAEHQVYVQLGREEDAEHVRRRIESWKRLREKARKACFVSPENITIMSKRRSLAEILAEFKPY